MAYWRGLFDPLILPAQWRCECGVIGCSTISMPSLHECPPARQQRGLFRPAASASAPAARSRTRNLEVNQAPSPASTPSPGGLAEGVRNPGILVLDSMRPRLSCTGFLPALHQAAQRTNDMSPLTLLLGALRPPRAWHKDHGTTASNIDSPAAAKCAAASLLPQGPALVHSTARTRPASVAPTFFLASIDYVRRDA